MSSLNLLSERKKAEEISTHLIVPTGVLYKMWKNVMNELDLNPLYVFAIVFDLRCENMSKDILIHLVNFDTSSITLPSVWIIRVVPIR